MVCSFFYYVLPMSIFMSVMWVWRTAMGKLPEEEPVEEKVETKADAAVKKGTCPYHAFMNFFGFKIPEKKTDVEQAPAADHVKAN